jgi:hypothetical protein
VVAVTDFSQTLDQQLYDRLQPRVTLAPVYQHVPQNTSPPVTIIADQFPEDIAGKDGSAQRIEFEIVNVIRGPARKPLNAAQQQVRDALHNWTPEHLATASSPDSGNPAYINAGAYSTEMLAGDFRIDCEIERLGLGLEEIGFGIDANPGALSYSAIDHCFFLFQLSTLPFWRVYRNDVLNSGTIGFPQIPYVFSVERLGSMIRYLIDDVVVYSYDGGAVVPLGFVVAFLHNRQVLRASVRELGVWRAITLTPHGGATATAAQTVKIEQIEQIGATGQLLEDGDHYYGSMRFKTFAQRL